MFRHGSRVEVWSRLVWKTKKKVCCLVWDVVLLPCTRESANKEEEVLYEGMKYESMKSTTIRSCFSSLVNENQMSILN